MFPALSWKVGSPFVSALVPYLAPCVVVFAVVAGDPTALLCGDPLCSDAKLGSFKIRGGSQSAVANRSGRSALRQVFAAFT